MARPGRTADQFQLRLPEGMRDHLKSTAEANGRSLNAEIVARLEESLAGDLSELGFGALILRLQATVHASENLFFAQQMRAQPEKSGLSDAEWTILSEAPETLRRAVITHLVDGETEKAIELAHAFKGRK